MLGLIGWLRLWGEWVLAKVRGYSINFPDSVTDGRTDGRTEAIALPNAVGNNWTVMYCNKFYLLRVLQLNLQDEELLQEIGDRIEQVGFGNPQL